MDGLTRYRVVWTYVANHGSYLFWGNSAEEVARRCFLGFSEDFRKRGTVYAFPEDSAVVMRPSDFEELEANPS